MADPARFDENDVAERLRVYTEELALLKNTSDFPPRNLEADTLPWVFFIPGRASYRKGRGAEYWTTSRDYRCFLVASTASMDRDRDAARKAARLLAAMRRHWMSVERLVMENGTAINVTPIGDGGIITERSGANIRFNIEFTVRVEYEEYIKNTGQ